METKNLSDTLPIEQFDFTIFGEKGTYRVTFLISGDIMKTNCTCHHAPGCWHVEYVLAGKKTRIDPADADKQALLLERAGQTAEGRYMLMKAQKKFSVETHCRRCHSTKIVKLNQSLSAQIRTLFREKKHHTYYCKDCGWTW